jgi:hypothetical protein
VTVEAKKKKGLMIDISSEDSVERDLIAEMEPLKKAESVLAVDL